MAVHVIKYYRGQKSISEFIGDDETVANTFFHMNFYSFLPVDFVVTKRNADNKEYVLRFITGGYQWKEIQLNNPDKEL